MNYLFGLLFGLHKLNSNSNIWDISVTRLLTMHHW